MSDSTLTSATTSSSGTTRISGLYSSTDVDSMVKASLTTEQTKIDNQSKKIQIQEWTQEAYEKINSAVSDFQEQFFTTSSNDSLMMKSKLTARTVTVSDSSAISVSASGSVSTESLTISSFTKATAASVSTGKMFTNEEAKTATKMTIADLATKLGVNATGSTTVTVTKKDDDGNVVKDDDGNEVTEEQQVDTYTFKLNGKEFTMNADKTVADMLSEINGADLGVKASFNVFTGEFSIEAKNTGTSGNISIEGEQDDLLAGIFKNSLDADGKINVSGTNAIINFEGNDESFEYESNQFTIDGYTFNILKDSTSSVDVTSKVDTDGMVSKITKFVNAYNDLMSTLQKYAYTKPDSDYTALTDDEKKEMTTSQIEEYEEKAKEGLLYGDSNIKKLMTNLRSLFTSTTSESGLKFYQIGIKTSAYSSSGTWGKVEIDETKLRNALETNSDDIASMFTTSTTSGSTQTQGIAVAMKTYTQSYQNNYKFKVSTRQSTKLSNMKEVLEKLKDQLADKEDRLYTKYSNMETSISSLSSQSSFLFSS